MINIAVRVDSSYQIGIGHVMRCITLAAEIKKQIKADIIFLCRAAEGSVKNKIEAAGFEYIELSAGIDDPTSTLQHGHWLRASQADDANEFIDALKAKNINYLDLIIVDHYGIDHEWHKSVQNFTKKIFVIDDLGDRKHNCDYLLDQTFSCNNSKYTQLVKEECQQMLGTQFALLRPEFEERKTSQKSDSALLVMFGGTDPDNLTLQALKVIRTLSHFKHVNVVLNDTAKYLTEVSEYCRSNKLFSLHISPNNIAELMANSVLAIGAAGTTSWERCALGLPTVVVIQAYNQREIASNLKKAGVISYIESTDIEKKLETEIRNWLIKLSSEYNIVDKCLAICDGKGAKRVAVRILND
ncbi:UDP-2,4-diacetamido-2,4,6-trideoxy-beta-L-altropyranose hydrolase [Thalassotalea piscium]